MTTHVTRALMAVTFLLSPLAHAGFWDRSCEHFLDARTAAPRPAPPPFTQEQVHRVLQKIEDYWTAEFAKRGRQFREIRYLFYTGQARSACGAVSRFGGPLYCANDATVYLDPYWFASMRNILGMENELFLTLVLAHEVGHHIQFQLEGFHRIRPLYQQRFGPAFEDEYFPRMEFQADCLAAVYMSHNGGDAVIASKENLIEALNRVRSLGDDYLQEQARRQAFGYAHGSSHERMSWFARGVKDPRMEACEPFGPRSLF